MVTVRSMHMRRDASLIHAVSGYLESGVERGAWFALIMNCRASRNKSSRSLENFDLKGSNFDFVG